MSSKHSEHSLASQSCCELRTVPLVIIHTPLSAGQVENGMSGGGGDNSDKVILVQSFDHKQESVERDDHGEPGTHEQQQQVEGQAKKDDEFKVEFALQKEAEDDIKMIRIDQEERKPKQVDLETEIDSEKGIEKVELVGDNARDVKSEVTRIEENDESTLIVVEKLSIIQCSSPISGPGSKIEMVAEGPETVDNEKEDNKPQTNKPDNLIPLESSTANDGEDPSNQELTKSKSSQHQPDLLLSHSNPLKPLPNFDDGITETKSEPRLPLLPPIGSKRIATLQSESGTLKSNSATGIVASTAAVSNGQSKGESAPSSKQPSFKKKKSTESLKSTSGPSTSKPKKSGSNINGNGTVSLGQKSKSRESLKLLGQQNRLTITSKSTNSLATGAAKKLSISRESLKAASHVYSSAPTAKNGEALKKAGDSGRSQSSKSKDSAKVEKERKSSEQKQADKTEVVAGSDHDGNKANEEMPESSNSEKNKSGDDSSQVVTAKEKPDLLEGNETTSPPTAVDEQITAKSNDPPSTKKEDTNIVEVAVVTVSEPEMKADTSDQTDMKTNASDQADMKVDTSDQTDVTGSTEADNTTKKDRESGEEKGEQSEEIEVKGEASGEMVKAEPTSTLNSITKMEQVTSQDKEVDSNTEKPADEESNPRQEGETESQKPPPSSNRQSKAEANNEDTEVKDSTRPQEDAKEVVPRLHPMNVVELPAKCGPGEDTASQISSSEFTSKLEIDKKTGQSEQSIVEAVEKSTTEPITATKDITTPA